MPPVVDTVSGVEVQVSEAVGLLVPSVWLDPETAPCVLSLKEAKRLAEQLLWLCDHHYSREVPK
jgi:hypothetical protein